MVRVARGLALVSLIASVEACGPGDDRARPVAPSARAPELAAVTPGCDDRTLAAFDPGLPGLERVAIAQRREPDPPLVREHVRPCEPAEDDAACMARAQRDVLAADPDATLGHVAISGEADGWAAQLEVDGQRIDLRVPNEADIIIEARRLQSLGHRVVPLEGRRVYRSEDRRAVVQYEVALPAAPARVSWEATLRWPLPPDVPAAIEQIQREVERAQLVVVRYEVGLDGISAAVACP